LKGQDRAREGKQQPEFRKVKFDPKWIQGKMDKRIDLHIYRDLDDGYGRGCDELCRVSVCEPGQGEVEANKKGEALVTVLQERRKSRKLGKGEFTSSVDRSISSNTESVMYKYRLGS